LHNGCDDLAHHSPFRIGRIERSPECDYAVGRDHEKQVELDTLLGQSLLRLSADLNEQVPGSRTVRCHIIIVGLIVVVVGIHRRIPLLVTAVFMVVGDVIAGQT
jgi:hypothetical protein